MISFNKIKEKLFNSISSLTTDFSEENIKILHMTDRLGIKSVVKNVKEFQSLNFIKLINLAIDLKNPKSKVNEKIREDNFIIFHYLSNIYNPYIINDIANNYFKKNDDKSIKIANYKNLQVETFIDSKHDIEFLFIHKEKRQYINPFTLNPVLISRVNEFVNSSSIKTSSILLRNRKSKDLDDVKIGVMDNIFDKKNDFIKSIGYTMRCKLKIEFSLYHELAHATSNQLFSIINKDNQQFIFNKREQHSDMSAIIKIIKENKFSQQQSLDLCDQILDYRIAKDYIHENIFLVKDLEGPITHSTQYGLIVLKKIIDSHFDLVKSTPDTEIAPFVKLIINVSSHPLFYDEFTKKILDSGGVKEFSINKMIFEDLHINDIVKNFEIIKKIKNKSIDFDAMSNLKSNVLNNPYIAVDIMIKSKTNHDKNYIKNFDFSLSNMLVSQFITQFKENKNEYNLSDLKLSEFFDAKEVGDKIEEIRNKNLNKLL